MTTRTTTAEERLAQLGIHLPDAPTPFGAYVPAVQTGSLLFLSGMLATSGHTATVVGIVGKDLDSSLTVRFRIYHGHKELGFRTVGVAPGFRLTTFAPARAYVSCCTVGGAATPTACNTRPAVPCSSLRNKKRWPVCST